MKQSRNQGHRIYPGIAQYLLIGNLHIARTYVAASDPGAIERPWRVPLAEFGKTRNDTRARIANPG